jgi:hypothetical protein
VSTVLDSLTQAAAPGTLDIVIVPGSTKSIPITFTDTTGVAISLTGATGTAQIRATPTGVVLATGTVVVSGNVATVTFSADDTVGLVPLTPPSDDPLAVRQPLVAGLWDLKLTVSGVVSVPVVGTVYIIQRITA